MKLIYGEIDQEAQIEYSFDFSKLNEYTEILKDCSTSLADSLKDICLQVNKEEFVKDYYSSINPL